MIDNQTERCQSCGMPIGVGFYGTALGGVEERKYCKSCYNDGAFTEPAITLDQMIARSIETMIRELKLSDTDAHELAYTVTPTLERWRTK